MLAYKIIIEDEYDISSKIVRIISKLSSMFSTKGDVFAWYCGVYI